jgi:hypothetical protein
MFGPVVVDNAIYVILEPVINFDNLQSAVNNTRSVGFSTCVEKVDTVLTLARDLTEYRNGVSF